MPYLLLAPGNLGNHTGRLAVDKPFAGSPKGLADYNPRSASPSDVWANDNAYHNTRQGRGEKGELLPLSGQNGSLKANNTSRRPSKGRQLMCGSSWRFSGVARSGGNVPAWLVFTFQAARRTFLFPRSPYSP